MDLNLPRTREEFTQLALVYDFDIKVTGLFGYLSSECKSEEEEHNVAQELIGWMLETLQRFPDLISFEYAKQRKHEMYPSIAIYCAGVFIFVLVPDHGYDLLKELGSNSEYDLIRKNINISINLYNNVIEKGRQRC